MPATFTHSPAETERKEPGIGGKPPVDRRPTGGGGGGGDDDWRHARRGPRELLHRIRFFVFFGLAGDMMFFAMLVVLFFARQAGTHLDPRSHEQIGDWRPILLPPIIFLNTAVLVLSSLTMEFARHNIFREIDVMEEWLGMGKPALRRTLPWVAGTLALGALFLVGQWTAWKQLTAQGFAFDRWSTPASYFFYIITGLARGASCRRHRGADRLPDSGQSLQACGVAADCRGCDGLVLAHHGTGVDGAAGGAGCRTMSA